MKISSKVLGKAFYMPELHNHHGQTEPIWYGGPSPVEYRPVLQYKQVPVKMPQELPKLRKLSIEKRDDSEKFQAQKHEIQTKPVVNPVKSLDECFYTKCDPFEEFKLFGKRSDDI